MLILWVLLSEINFQKNVYTCLVLLIILNFFKLNLLFVTLQNKNLSEVILSQKIFSIWLARCVNAMNQRDAGRMINR